jgi:excisionase family DNA binding protein
MNEKLRKPEEVCEYYGVPLATLYAWRYRGEGPRSIKVGRHLRYRQEDLDAWLEEQATQP